jgi:polar amino acid transport system substrate-binding protein
MIRQKLVSLFVTIGLGAILLSPTKPTLAAEFKEITQRGKLIVAVKDNLPPLGFTDERGNLQGLEIDLAKQLAKELLGNADAVEFKPVTNQDRLKVVLEGKVDLTIARVTATASRSRVVDFSRYYYLDATGLVTKESSVKNLSDLGDRKIAVLNNSSTIAIIQNELPNAQLIGVDSYQEALNLLETGGAAAFAGDRSLLTGWVQEDPNYRQLPETLSAEALCVVMPRGLQYTELRNKVNDAIETWQQSGWLRERIIYWGLASPQ